MWIRPVERSEDIIDSVVGRLVFLVQFLRVQHLPQRVVPVDAAVAG